MHNYIAIIRVYFQLIEQNLRYINIKPYPRISFEASTLSISPFTDSYLVVIFDDAVELYLVELACSVTTG
jgi:hypothetical protein